MLGNKNRRRTTDPYEALGANRARQRGSLGAFLNRTPRAPAPAEQRPLTRQNDNESHGESDYRTHLLDDQSVNADAYVSRSVMSEVERQQAVAKAERREVARKSKMEKIEELLNRQKELKAANRAVLKQLRDRELRIAELESARERDSIQKSDSSEANSRSVAADVVDGPPPQRTHRRRGSMGSTSSVKNIDKAKSTIANLRKQNFAKDQEIVSLEQEIDSHAAEISGLQKELGHTTLQLENLEEEHSRNQGLMIQMSEEINLLRDEYNRLLENGDSGQQSYDSHEAVNNLKRELSIQSDRLLSIQTDYDDLKLEIEEVENERDDWMRRARENSNADQLPTLQSRVQELEEENSYLVAQQKAPSHLESEVKALKKERDEALAKVKENEKLGATGHSTDTAEMEEEIKDLKEEVARWKAAAEQASESMHGWKEEEERAEKHYKVLLEAAKQENKLLKEQHAEDMSAAASASARLTMEHEKESEKFAQLLENHKARCTQLENEIRMIEEERDDFEKKADDAYEQSKGYDKLKCELEELRDVKNRMLEEHQEELNTYSTAATAAAEKVVAIKQLNEELQRTLEDTQEERDELASEVDFLNGQRDEWLEQSAKVEVEARKNADLAASEAELRARAKVLEEENETLAERGRQAVTLAEQSASAKLEEKEVAMAELQLTLEQHRKTQNALTKQIEILEQERDEWRETAWKTDESRNSEFELQARLEDLARENEQMSRRHQEELDQILRQAADKSERDDNAAMEDMKRRIQHHESKQVEMAAEIHLLATQRDQWQEEAERSRGEMQRSSAIAADTSKLHERVGQLEQEKKRLSKEHKAALTAAATTANKRTSELEKSLDEARASLEEHQLNEEELEQEIENVRKDRDHWKESSAEAWEKAAAAPGVEKKLKQQIEELELNAGELEREIEDIRKDRDHWKDSSAEAWEKAAAAPGVEKRLNERIEELEHNEEELQKKIVDVRKDRDYWKESSAEAIEKAAAAPAVEERLNERIEELRRTEEELKKDIEDVKKDRDHWKSTSTELTEKAAAAAAAAVPSSADEELQEQMKKLEAKLAIRTKEQKQAVSLAEEANNEVMKLEDEFEEMERLLEVERIKVRELQSELNLMEAKREKLAKAAEEAKDARSVSGVNDDDTRRRFEELELENSYLLTKHQEALEKQADLEHEIDALTHDCSQWKTLAEHATMKAATIARKMGADETVKQSLASLLEQSRKVPPKEWDEGSIGTTETEKQSFLKNLDTRAAVVAMQERMDKMEKDGAKMKERHTQIQKDYEKAQERIRALEKELKGNGNNGNLLGSLYSSNQKAASGAEIEALKREKEKVLAELGDSTMRIDALEVIVEELQDELTELERQRERMEYDLEDKAHLEQEFDQMRRIVEELRDENMELTKNGETKDDGNMSPAEVRRLINERDSLQEMLAKALDDKRPRGGEVSLSDHLEGEADDSSPENLQANLLAAAARSKSGSEDGSVSSGWRKIGLSVFKKREDSKRSLMSGTTEGGDQSVSGADKNHADFEKIIASQKQELKKLRSDVVRIQSSYKEELYLNKMKIARLEQDNEAYSLKVSVLEQQFREEGKSAETTSVKQPDETLTSIQEAEFEDSTHSLDYGSS